MAMALVPSGTGVTISATIEKQRGPLRNTDFTPLIKVHSSSRASFAHGHSQLRSRKVQKNLLPVSRTNTSRIVCAADLKQQIKDMAAAEKRWESQVTEGKVKSMSAKEAGYAFQLADYYLLDVRPTYQRQQAWVKDSTWVPAFDEDKGLAPGTLANKLTTFILGGWWSGDALTKRNERFMPDVVSKIPKSSNVIVACQKGMRSLAACEQLYKAGYRNIYWLNGGFDNAEDEDFEKEGLKKLKFAGLGGMSEFLGWSDIQRQQAAKEGISSRLVIFGRLVAVVIAADLAFVGFQELTSFLQKVGRS